MRVIAAYMLAVLGGNQNPSAADIKAILASVGIEADAADISKVTSALEGKDLDAVIREGSSKLAAVPTGGAAAAAAPAAAAKGGAAPAAAAAPAKKESSSSSSEGGAMDLFGNSSD